MMMRVGRLRVAGKKELLFSVTAKDCDWSYTRGTGNGGQAKNKTSSAVHCTHRASGAHGYAEDSRVQKQNRSTAFARMCGTEKFKAWHKLEVSRKTGQEEIIERNVEKAMKQIRVDVKENGLWKAIDKDAVLTDDM
jgi:protein subunit release factor B